MRNLMREPSIRERGFDASWDEHVSKEEGLDEIVRAYMTDKKSRVVSRISSDLHEINPVDVSSGGFSFERIIVAKASVGLAVRQTWLMLPGTRYVESKQLLPGTRAPIVSESNTFILGRYNDPLEPFVERFASTMQTLENISANDKTPIVIQTRSSLLTLALPVLRRLAPRLKIRVAIEALSDLQGIPALGAAPRPSERIKLVRALKSFGFDVGVQLSPIFASTMPKDISRDIELVAAELSGIANDISIVPLSELYGGHVSPEMQGLVEAQTRDARYHRLARELFRLRPGSVFMSREGVRPSVREDLAA
jgi:hypothetical protein